MNTQRRASNKSVSGLALDMDRLRLGERRPGTGGLSLSRQLRGSSTGSSLSSLSPDDERPRPITSRTPRSRPTQRPTNPQTQKLNTSNLARLTGNRPTKVIETSKKCAGCSKPLKEDGFFALGELYHKSCFRCKFCKKRLGEKFFVKAGGASCAECFNTTRCFVCKQIITEGHITFGDKSYHTKCMKCQICGEQVCDKYLTFNDLPICEKDFRRVGHVCSVCDDLILDQVYNVEGVVMCEKDYNELISTWPCSACGKQIPQDSHAALMVGEARFHHDCLRCVTCRTGLDGKMVTLDKENRPYCSKCYDKMFSLVCAGCLQPIQPKKGQTKAPRIRALDQDYHINCFKCFDCSIVLSPGTKGREPWPGTRNRIFCYKCYRRRQSESESESD